MIQSFRYRFDGDVIESRIFEVEDESEPVEGWYDSPQKARESFLQPAVDAIVDGSMESMGLQYLRNHARSLGVPVDGRWGAARLREEIAKYE